MQRCLDIIKTYSKKQYNIITSRGNAAINAAIFLAKQQGCTHLLIPDQGGWLTYKKYGKQHKLIVETITTNDGLITQESFNNLKKENKYVLLFTTLAGYYAQQDTTLIKNMAKQNNIFLIEDCSAVFRSKFQPIGDIVLASFGEWKLINNFAGGFLGFNNKDYLNILQTQQWLEKIAPKIFDYEKLLTNLNKADQRYQFLTETCKKIKKDLAVYNILQKDKEGIVVVIAEDDENKIAAIKEYCHHHKLEYTLCPREIRVKRKGISIEVKRLE